jgi:hypothetical protein
MANGDGQHLGLVDGGQRPGPVTQDEPGPGQPHQGPQGDPVGAGLPNGGDGELELAPGGLGFVLGEAQPAQPHARSLVLGPGRALGHRLPVGGERRVDRAAGASPRPTMARDSTAADAPASAYSPVRPAHRTSSSPRRTPGPTLETIGTTRSLATTSSSDFEVRFAVTVVVRCPRSC